MAQPPPNVFKKDIVANAATLPPTHAVAPAPATMANTNPANHILPTSAIMLGICVILMALSKLLNLRTGAGLMHLAMAFDSLFFLLSAVCSFISMRLGMLAAVMERISAVVFVLGVLLLALSGFAFAIDVI
ncbi:MAG: hypothetical protein U1F63_12375 [Chitinivorax sp.]